MAIAVLMEFDGDLETHVKISDAHGDAPIAGLIVHWGGPSPHGVYRLDVWETERNKAVIRRFVEEVQNNQDWATYDELNDPAFINLSAPPGAPADRDGGKLFLQELAAAYPDAVFTIDDMFAEGDAVITRKTFTGTSEREFMGVPATGRQVSLQYVDIMRVRDGRIVSHWNVLDQLSWMVQLGLIPDPADPSSA